MAREYGNLKRRLMSEVAAGQLGSQQAYADAITGARRSEERPRENHATPLRGQATHNVADLRGRTFSPDAHSDFVARPIKVSQPHGHRHAITDRDLWKQNGVGSQASAVDIDAVAVATGSLRPATSVVPV